MVSTVLRIDERKDTNEAHVIVGKRKWLRNWVSARNRFDVRIGEERSPPIASAQCFASIWNESRESCWQKGCRGAYDTAGRDRRR
jgi:hypothetical protein